MLVSIDIIIWKFTDETSWRRKLRNRNNERDPASKTTWKEKTSSWTPYPHHPQQSKGSMQQEFSKEKWWTGRKYGRLCLGSVPPLLDTPLSWFHWCRNWGQDLWLPGILVLAVQALGHFLIFERLGYWLSGKESPCTAKLELGKHEQHDDTLPERQPAQRSWTKATDSHVVHKRESGFLILQLVF